MKNHSNLLKHGGYNQLAETDDSYCLYNKNDMYIGKSIEMYGEYSGLEMSVLRQLCTQGDTVIEVGANIGTHTINFSKSVGATGKVFAFEPQRLVFQTLCANVALNSLENVFCYWAALGPKEGMLTVPELNPKSKNNFGALSLSNHKTGTEVPCLTLDHFIFENRIRLIKVDVEGMEIDVLNGGKELIEKHKPFLYLENDRIEKSESLIKLVDSLGYRMFWHLPPLYNPKNCYSNKENIFPNIVSVNMVCIHRDSDINMSGFTEITNFSIHPLAEV